MSRASQKVLMCLLFKSVEKKSRYFSEGKARKKFFASGFAFERLTFLSKVENRLKRGEKKMCESFTGEDILNVWIMAIYGFSCLFSFRWLWSHTFKTDDLNLIIFKYFGVRWRGSRRNASLCSIGCELLCGIADSA